MFIPNINEFKTNSFQKVVVFVPGIAATVERRTDDTLVITTLTLSEEYDSIARGSTQKPGVYSVSKDRRGVEASYRNNGRIKSTDERKVVIADTDYRKPADAATGVTQRLSTMFGASAALKCDFDLFYSPLGSKLKGMRNYNPVNVHKTYGYAGLLADAIEQSINKKGVEWTSERSGSVVLTQALKTLAAKNLSYKKQKHIVKMCWATSNPWPTYEAVSQLGMIADKQLFKSNSHIRASLTTVLGNRARVKNQDDPYSKDDYAKDLANGTMAANTVIGIGALGTSVALAGTPAGLVLGTVGSVTGTVGALQFVYSKIKSRMERG